MKRKAFVLLYAGLLLAAISLVQVQNTLPKGDVLTEGVAEATKQRIVETYGKLPLSFEANQGQTDSRVKFISRGPGYTLFLNSTEAVLSFPSRDRKGAGASSSLPGSSPPSSSPPEGRNVLRMQLVGANPHPEVKGLEELPGKSNYFLGNDPDKWRTDVPTYAKVQYKNVYPGVDLVYYGNQRQLEYDLIVAPGTDPDVIQLAFEGNENLEIDAQGDLVLHTAGEEVRLHKPLVYQHVDGVQREVAGAYVVNRQRQVSFQVAAYDASQPLIIDPVLSYSTYLGGTNSDSCRGIAADSAGNTYVSGRTFSPDFPTTLGAPFIGCFVTKFNATGSALVYSTFESGFCGDIAVDSAGNAYSPLVTKLNAAGDALVYSMHLGGKAIAVDASGNAYVTGSTRFNFPPTVNPIQPNIAGGQDTFIAKITDEPPGPPTLPANSVVNGASFRPATEPNSAIAPGAIVAIFGADLASETVLAGEVPLPTTLGETSVTFDNILASLFFISRVQINAQVPFELTTGAGSVTVQVTRGSETTEAQPTEIAAVSPGIFTLNQQGSGPAAILHAEDFQPVTASAPAQPGEFLAIFCTGLGPVQPEVASGDVAPSTEPLARTVTLPMVNIAGIAADVTFSGLAPGFVGLYQVNVQVPSGVPVDVQDVEVIINGVSSQIVTVHVAS